MTLYADILFLVNFYVNFFLITAVARAIHLKISIKRTILSASIGGIMAFEILLPPLPIPVTMLLGIVNGVILCVAAFGFSKWRNILFRSLMLWSFSFLFAGIMMALGNMLPSSTDIIRGNNGQIYFDISLMQLGLFSIICYFAAWLFQRVYLRRKQLNTNSCDKKYVISIIADGNIVALEALPDSGNLLKDPFTGQLVIVCPTKELRPLFKSELFDLEENMIQFRSQNPHLKRIHVIPFHTVNGNGLLPVFEPDSIRIYANGDKEKIVDALIGAASFEQSHIIFNPLLLDPC